MATSLPSISFLAVDVDIRPLMSVIESTEQVQFMECGVFEQKQRRIIFSLNALDSLGIAETGDSNLEPSYLVSRRGSDIQVRTIPQRKGGTKFAVDQLANPSTVVFRPGGMVPTSNVVIGGTVGTVRDDPGAEKLMKLFSGEIRNRFVRIKGLWLGPSTLAVLRAGGRLTNAVSAPLEYDLSIE